MSDLENSTDGQDRKTTERRKLRPFRALIYALYLTFALTFIALVARSIWLDLYGKGPVRGLRAENPTVEACVDELERLYSKLASRAAFPATETELRNWDEFSRELEDRLDEFESKCVTEPASEAEVPLRAAISRTADQLENWRQHLSRCGEEGEQDRSSLVKSIAELRQAARPRS